MILSLQTLLVAGAALAPLASASTPADLVGTWTTKSRTVFTGPGFYDPVNDKFSEPTLPGISYSFTSDGYYEEAYYRTESNPTKPSCPKGVIQWQHGKYAVNSTGSINLTPVKVDGRMLVSDPCSYKSSVYTRYDQAENFEWYEVVLDDYHGIKRLNLYQFDGNPQIPMYIAYTPPQMLPTQTLNPTASAAASGTSSTSTSKAKQKRSMPEDQLFAPTTSRFADPSRWWWLGVCSISVGAMAYIMG